SWGCRVVVADSSAAALRGLAAQRAIPEAIVADYRLAAGETGLDAIKQIRAFARWEVPAVVVSGEDSFQSLDARSTLLPWLMKPVRPARLRAVLMEILRPEEQAPGPRLG
ncbi:MAG: response regulator, partial [Candidatus Rokuibacteriota bacterium]